jgi:hypothetical protein
MSEESVVRERPNPRPLRQPIDIITAILREFAEEDPADQAMLSLMALRGSGYTIVPAQRCDATKVMAGAHVERTGALPS